MYLLKVNERIDKHDNGLQTILTNLNSPNQMHCRVICQLVLHFQLILHIGTSECKLNKHSLHQSPSIGEHLNDVLGLHRVFLMDLFTEYHIIGYNFLMSPRISAAT